MVSNRPVRLHHDKYASFTALARVPQHLYDELPGSASFILSTLLQLSLPQNLLDHMHWLQMTTKVTDMNKNIKMSSFTSSENIQKKEEGPDRSVSDNQSSSVTLNELAKKARKNTVILIKTSP